MIDLIAIVGQTASGKSSLAMELAQTLGAEIICGDSLTVYKGLDIGTAKPTKADQKQVRHHLVDIVSPSEEFNVARFQRLAFKAIKDIQQRGKLPILVGGSGLYIDSILFNYNFNSKVGKKPEFRQQLESLSIEQLQAKIRELNLKMPQNKQNQRYLIRTLERGFSSDQDSTKSWRPNTLAVGLRLDRNNLLERIESRLEAMLNCDLLEEIEWALKNYPAESEALKGNAYIAFKPYIQKQISLNQARQNFIKLDLALAKKQNTWFKRHTQIQWFDDSKLACRHILSSLN